MYVSLFLCLACFEATAAEIVVGKTPGSIMLRDKGSEISYGGVVGEKDGFYRRLITINGGAALHVSSRFEFYYTLIVDGGNLLIDCAYFDVRNNYNGARAAAGMCGLNKGLEETYDEIAQDYSNELRESIFSFDTSPVVEKAQATNFFLGKIGEVEIYDRYPSLDSLIGASPHKYIKASSGCFDFGNVNGFLVFYNSKQPNLKYLDLLRFKDPMKFQRLQEDDLKKLAVNKCL